MARLLAASPGQASTSSTGAGEVGSPDVRMKASVSTNTSNVWSHGHPGAHGTVENGQNTSHHGWEVANGLKEDGNVTNIHEQDNHIRQNSNGDIHGGDMDLESNLGIYRPVTQTPVKNDQVQASVVSWESPVLGESVSMYERENDEREREREEHELFENILGRVKRLLADDTSNNVDDNHGEAGVIKDVNVSDDVKENKSEEFTEEEEARPDPTLATWDRLKQLGVSFISAGDLTPAGQQLDTTAAGQPFNSIWLPQARLPLMSSSSPDTSLAINNLALKYLSDAELGKLAALHQKQDNKNKGKIYICVNYFIFFILQKISLVPPI